ncbi:hypothetical protein ACQPUY_05865 [Clostridium nigeriense]|uniref:hypothetical protein n=1 Tax=Clostridium nigeriense TaxID=1805470 RepID=UPI003D327ABE
MENDNKEKLELKIKKSAILIVIIVNIIVGLCLNFNEILTGGPISSKNIIVSIGYLLVWILSILLAKYLKSKNLLKIFLGFWIVNLFMYILVMILLNFSFYPKIFIIFVIIFIGPMHGIYIGNSIITISIIDILISIFIYYIIKREK